VALKGTRILNLLGTGKLTIVPLLAGKVDFRETSVDLHLGHHFLVPRRGDLETLKPLDATGAPGGPLQPESVGLQPLWLPVGSTIHLHPREFLLAATLEYVGLPPSVCAQVMGRSRWARVGLVVQMASFVHPGYRGCLTLEMQNLGSTPIQLQPYLRVAHLVLEPASDSVGGRGTTRQSAPSQITCAVRPEYWPLVSASEKQVIKALVSRSPFPQPSGVS